MDEDLQQSLYVYFNDVLKKSLGYLENYHQPYFAPEENTIFFDRIDESQPEGLKDILSSNPDIAAQLKQTLFESISQYYKDLISVKLIFNSKGFGIVLKTFEPAVILPQMMSYLPELSVDNYVEIAKNFETVSQLNEFCRSTSSINGICKANEFWSRLLSIAYPYVNQRGYNSEKVYKGYLTYKYYKDNPGLLNSYKNLSSTGEYVKFLIGNQLLLTLEDRISILNISIQLNLDTIFDEFLSGGVTPLIENLKKVFFTEFNMDNVDYIINFFRMLLLNDNIIIFINFIYAIMIALHHGDLTLSSKMWNAIYHILKDYHGRNSSVNSDLMIHFNGSGIIQALISNDLQLLTQILSTGEFHPLDVIGGMRRLISTGNPSSRESIDIIRKSLKPKDIDTLDKMLEIYL